MRNLRENIHALDDALLINQFYRASEQSPDDEFIQILLGEILERELSIEEVLNPFHVH